jgi:hypothetical protein
MLELGGHCLAMSLVIMVAAIESEEGGCPISVPPCGIDTQSRSWLKTLGLLSIELLVP